MSGKHVAMWLILGLGGLGGCVDGGPEQARSDSDPPDPPAVDSEAAPAPTVAEETFADGLRAFEDGDCESAYFTFAELPEDSALRDRDEVAEAEGCYAEEQLELANKRLDEGRIEEAHSRAEGVLALESPPRGLAEEAGRLEQRARRAKRERRADGESRHAQDVEGTRRPATDGSSTGMKAATQCLMRGDNPCIVRALEGHTDSPAELALLIETYRTMGNNPAALREARQLLQRFPNDPRAPRYREMIREAEGGG